MENVRKVLVIGKNSYIGKNFIQYCKSCTQNPTERGEQVNILVDAISGKNGEWKQWNFEEYHSVILLSGIVHIQATKELYYEVNYKMAVDIAKKAKDAHVKQFIFMSTIAVFGDHIQLENNMPVINPQTEYAKTKQKAANDIVRMGDTDFHVAIVQPPMVYGKDCPGNFKRLVNLIKQVHVFPKFINRRSSIYVINLCEFLRLLVITQQSGSFVPQNAEYLSSLDIALAIKKKGNGVLLLHGVNPFIRLAGLANKQVSKVFGEYQYPLALSKYDGLDYQKCEKSDSLDASI